MLHQRLLCLVLASASPAVAQEFILDDPIRWPSSGPSGAISRLAAIDLDSDGLFDIAALSGTTPCLVWGAVAYTTVLSTGSSANDLDAAPAAAPGGGNAIAIVNATGLQLVMWEGSTAPHFSVTTLDSANWAGAKRVRCRDLNNSGNVDYYGIGSDQRTILVRRDPAPQTPPVEPPPQTPVHNHSFTMSADVIDVVAVEWDGDAALEIAVLMAGAVEIYNLNGTGVESFTGSSTGGDSLTVASSVGATRDRIAWVDKGPSGTQTLRVLRPGQNESGGDLNALGGLKGFFSAVAGDMDGDGHDELVIAYTGDISPLLIENAETNPWFSVPSSGPPYGDEYIPIGGPAATTVTPPLVADLFGEGTLSIVVVDEATKELRIGHWGYPVSKILGGAATLYSGNAISGTTPTLSLKLSINDDIAANWSYQVVVRKQTDGSITDPEIDPTPCSDYWFVFPENTGPLFDGDAWTGDIVLPHTGMCSNELYWIEIRRLAPDGTPAIPVDVDFISFSYCDAVIEDWEELTGSTGNSVSCPSCDCTNVSFCNGEGLQQIPAVVGRRRLPPISNDSPPLVPIPDFPLELSLVL